MIIKTIKGLFNITVKLLTSALVLFIIYAASTGNLKNINLEQIQKNSGQLIAVATNLIKNANIIKVVPEQQNNMGNTQNLQQDNTQSQTNSLQYDMIITPTPYVYQSAKSPIYISSTQTNDIFNAKDYTKAQLHLNFKTPIVLHCQILTSQHAKELGYMYKPFINDYECLIFTYKTPSSTPFYMKNVNFPLDIIFMNQDLKIISIVNNAPPCKTNDCPLYFPPHPYRIVIETKGKNWEKFTK